MGTVSVFNVKDYGAVGDGTTDDAGAIQAAVNAAAVAGGAVYFPVPGRYRLNSQILVRSVYPVHLLSDMFGFTDGSAQGNFLCPGANFGDLGMVRYEAPNPAVRGAHGAGLIRGLCFVDPFGDPAAHTPLYTIGSALDLHDFNLGRVEYCMFHVLKGSAIRTEYFVQAGLAHLQVRFCGAPGKPAVDFAPAGFSDGATQSSEFVCSRVEQNRDAAYIRINAYCQEVQLANLGFEADTQTPAENQTFIDNAGRNTQISDCTLKRCMVTQLICRAESQQAQIDNVHVYAGLEQAGPQVELNGAAHIVRGLIVDGGIGQTGPALVVNGAFIRVIGFTLANGGGVTISNGSNQLIGGFISGLKAGTAGYAVELAGGDHHLVAHCLFRALPAGMGGVRAQSGTSHRIIGNDVSGITGSVSAYRDDSTTSGSTWVGNVGSLNASDFTFGTANYTAVGNVWNTPGTIEQRQQNMLHLTGAQALLINGAKVVGTQRPGWQAPTGTATRSTFATGTVTLAQLAQRVKALIDDLSAHGLIGP